MRGLCKIGCGYELEYESHEFSDGFVYYLPKNLDKTVHNCIFSDEGLQILDDDMFESFYHYNKNRLKITKDELMVKTLEQNVLTLKISMDLKIMHMLREGKMFKLKESLENELNAVTMPFFKHRGVLCTPPVSQNVSLTNASQKKIMGYTWIELPTSQGYQLEYLGKFYELMIRLEDAKKCYQLQYECTKEPELLDIIKKLDEQIKIQSKDEKILLSVVDPVVLKNTVDETEEKLRQYVVALFSNDMNKIWKRLPWLKKQIQKVRKKEQESIIPIKDKTDVERLSLGMFIAILEESISKRKSNSDGKCEKCGKMWKRNDYVFLATKSKENECLICSNEVCFKDQGGLVSDVGRDLFSYIHIITGARNAYSHKRSYDQVMLQNVFRTAMSACTTVNNVIDDYLDKKNLI